MTEPKVEYRVASKDAAQAVMERLSAMIKGSPAEASRPPISASGEALTHTIVGQAIYIRKLEISLHNTALVFSAAVGEIVALENDRARSKADMEVLRNTVENRDKTIRAHDDTIASLFDRINEQRAEAKAQQAEIDEQKAEVDYLREKLRAARRKK